MVIKLIKTLVWFTYFFYIVPRKLVLRIYNTCKIWWDKAKGSTVYRPEAEKKVRRVEQVLGEEINYWERWLTGTEMYVDMENKKRLVANDPKKSIDFRILEDDQRGVVNRQLRQVLRYVRSKIVITLKFCRGCVLFPFWWVKDFLVRVFTMLANFFSSLIVGLFDKIEPLIVQFYNNHRDLCNWLGCGLEFFVFEHLVNVLIVLFWILLVTVVFIVVGLAVYYWQVVVAFCGVFLSLSFLRAFDKIVFYLRSYLYSFKEAIKKRYNAIKKWINNRGK